MLRTLQRQDHRATTTRVANRLPKELVYTKSGRLGFFQSETALTVTIRLGPDTVLTLFKDDIDHRVRVV